MSKDIIVVVPPGTRVRYIENPYTNGEMYIMDAAKLAVTSFEFEPIDTFAPLSSVPLYDAEKYTPDA